MQLDVGADAVVERFDFIPEIRGTKHLIGNGPGECDFGGGGPGFLAQPEREGNAHAVDDQVGHMGGDDFAFQVMLVHLIGETLADRPREIVGQHQREFERIRYARIDQRFVHGDLGVSQ